MTAYTDHFKYTIEVYKRGHLYTRDVFSPDDFNFLTPDEMHISYFGDKYNIIMDTGTEVHEYPALSYEMFLRQFYQLHG